MALKIAFISAGGVNFGGPEGPWDHASRLEKIGDITVVAIVDVDLQRAQKVLDQRRSSEQYGHMYSTTKLYKSGKEMLEDLSSPTERPDAVFIGAPPACHGSTKEPFDIEIQCAKRGIHMFIEKPISCFPMEEVEATNRALKDIQGQREEKLVISIGYMLRYHKAVARMKEIIDKETTGRILNIMARYNCAYTSILKPSWWDVESSGGPIIEQATHFVDLSRYIVGDEVNMTSLRAVAVQGSSPLGKLSKCPVDDSSIPENRRIPRTTTALWTFENGVVCSLHHGLLMHGTSYSAELEVWGDGFKITLINPYGDAKLQTCLGANQTVETLSFEDDMYYNEAKAFIDAIRTNGSTNNIKSDYDDALKTYEVTWAIRKASEST